MAVKSCRWCMVATMMSSGCSETSTYTLSTFLTQRRLARYAVTYTIVQAKVTRLSVTCAARWTQAVKALFTNPPVAAVDAADAKVHLQIVACYKRTCLTDSTDACVGPASSGLGCSKKKRRRRILQASASQQGLSLASKASQMWIWSCVTSAVHACRC